jgi:hypothetical protein
MDINIQTYKNSFVNSVIAVYPDLINSMKFQSSSEANSRSLDFEVSHFVWNPNVHYREHKDPLFVPILSQTNTAHSFTIYVFKIHFNITLPSTPRPPWPVFNLRSFLNFSANTLTFNF